MEGWFFLAPGTASAAVGLTILALCSEHWTASSLGYAGLWNGCVFVRQSWYCGKTIWPNGDQWILAVKTLVIASAALGIFTAIMAFLAHIHRSSKWSHRASTAILLQEVVLGAGLFTFLAYICKYGNRFDLSWSYALGWISVAFYILAMIFFTMQAKRLRVYGLYEDIEAI